MATGPGCATREPRLTAAAKRTLDAAAAAAGLARRSVGDRVPESALTRAEGILAERRRFGPDAEPWAPFMAALGARPRPLPRLESLFSKPRRWRMSGGLRCACPPSLSDDGDRLGRGLVP
jgi:uncharacterized protein (DUF1778 family)